jgi:Flp pilus assembly protein TadB
MLDTLFNKRSNNIKNIVNAQRQTNVINKPDVKQRSNMIETNLEKKIEVKKVHSKLTMEKRLKYAGWKIPAALFHAVEIGISVFVFTSMAALGIFNVVILFMFIFVGPIISRWILNKAVSRRFNAFDADYPSFLLSLVGLLKTGMNPMGAIEASAKGMEDGSIIKFEVELMLERLRYGVPEDQSIGSFAEDINHSEIELFVQALLLSRRVGGTLSDTLDRLARQVRKRQYFRKQAHAAVGMQRGSIWFILGIMICLELYLYVVFPESVVGAIKNPVGWQVWQFGILVIIAGIFWIRQVTKLKV